jgi:hypothetical protein
MKYIMNTTAQEYSIEGILIPKQRYTQFEVDKGKSAVLALADADYEKLAANGYFQRGLTRGLFAVSETAPLDRLSDSEKAKVYESKLAESAKGLAELAGLREQVAERDKELAALRAELAARGKKEPAASGAEAGKPRREKK